MIIFLEITFSSDSMMADGIIIAVADSNCLLS